MPRHEDIYLLARHVGRRIGVSHVIEVGFGDGPELAKLHQEFSVMGFGDRAAVVQAEATRPWASWFEWSASQPLPSVLADLFHPKREALPNSVVICHDVMPQLDGEALPLLHALMEYVPAAVISSSQTGPEADNELRTLLERAGLRVEFSGWTTPPRDTLLKGGEDAAELDPAEFLRGAMLPESFVAAPRPIAVVANNHLPEIGPAPADFRAVALVALYNEEDVIETCLTTLIEAGVEVYILNNWSTDNSVELAERFLGKGLIAIEHFPPEGKSDQWDWSRMLNRMEAVALELGADWYLHTDADEVRRSPWPGVSLRDALFYVGTQGFNVVDHSALHFRPVDNDFLPSMTMEEHFHHYSYDPVIDNQLKTWKASTERVYLAGAGHRVTFSGRRVFPYNFLYKHFPIRSQPHGEQKIRERLKRIEAGEHRAGWHAHTHEQALSENHLRNPGRMRSWDETYFQTNLVELLCAVGPDERTEWRRPPASARAAAIDDLTAKARQAAASTKRQLQRQVKRRFNR